MAFRRSSWALALVGALAAGSACLPRPVAAGAILRPLRHTLFLTTSLPHREVSFTSDGLTLRGWLFPATGTRRGLIVYLHGHSDNRHESPRAAARFTRLGYDVLAYDSRAHGESDGEFCTYGFHEKQDLGRVLDAVGATRAIVIGSSLGAGVALQAAVEDPRIQLVVAHAPFTDLRAAIADRSAVFSKGTVAGGIEQAEREAGFDVDEVSPLSSAARLEIPVLLLHGKEDRQTPPAHSERILAALRGPKKLVLVDGAGHADVYRRESVWDEVERWILEHDHPEAPDRAL